MSTTAEATRRSRNPFTIIPLGTQVLRGWCWGLFSGLLPAKQALPSELPVWKKPVVYLLSCCF